MSFFSDAENAVFMDTADFGTTALVNGAISVDGVFDEDYAHPLGMSASAPAFLCQRTDEYPALPGDVLDIGERRWIVTVVEPDGQGVQLLKLRSVS